MTKDKVEKVLEKILPFIKPDDVVNIELDVRHTSPDEFTLYAVFVVPDELWDSYNDLNKAAFGHQVKVNMRQRIKAYTGINVVFDKHNTMVVRQSDWG